MRGSELSPTKAGRQACHSAAAAMATWHEAAPDAEQLPLLGQTREAHPGLPFLLWLASSLKSMKAVTTFGTAASQMIRRTGSEADRKWVESWQRWIRRLSALAFGGITAAGVYLYVDGQDTIAASGRTRLLLTTRQEERELGDAVSEQLLAQVGSRFALEEVYCCSGVCSPPLPSQYCCCWAAAGVLFAFFAPSIAVTNAEPTTTPSAMAPYTAADAF